MSMTDFFQFYISLLVICSPFIAVPALINLTQGHSRSEKRRAGSIAAFAVTLVLVASAWIGTSLLAAFGISVSSFRLAGGIIIFLLALSMLRTEFKEEKVKGRGIFGASVAVVPLAIPLIAGPGSISSVIVATTEFLGVWNQVYISIAATLVGLSLWICLFFSFYLEKWLGVIGLSIVSRLGGLILAAISVEVMTKGIIGLFPVLR
jgi:multiple antibiotic resistance protein